MNEYLNILVRKEAIRIKNVKWNLTRAFKFYYHAILSFIVQMYSFIELVSKVI